MLEWRVALIHSVQVSGIALAGTACLISALHPQPARVLCVYRSCLQVAKAELVVRSGIKDGGCKADV